VPALTTSADVARILREAEEGAALLAHLDREAAKSKEFLSKVRNHQVFFFSFSLVHAP